MAYRIGVDVGGTFTDFSLFNAEGTELIHFKDSSTPDDPSKAIMHGIMHLMEELKIMPEENERVRGRVLLHRRDSAI